MGKKKVKKRTTKPKRDWAEYRRKQNGAEINRQFRAQQLEKQLRAEGKIL